MELKEYTIKELLSNYKLVIPEIQREYVWGSNKTVLEKFLSELNESLAVSEYSEALEITEKSNICDLKKQLETTLTKVNNVYETNIGFLYSYDAGNDEHYIIDGQQRLTTIVLLLYFYWVKEEKVNEKKIDFKSLLNASGTFMNFSYRVRPLTEQFLVNLFNDENIAEESFKKLNDSKWYVSDYDGDTTISSICKLYEWISDKDNANKFPNLNYDSLLNRVKFYYFDVQQTSQGEELYITMNSRGEQLKDNEQIKPYILEKVRRQNGDKAAEECAKEWEKWEEFFFKRRGENSVESIDTAIENIIKIALELYGKRKLPNTFSENEKWEYDSLNASEDSNRIDFSEIRKAFELVKDLFETTNAEIQNLNLLDFFFSEKRERKTLFLIETLMRAVEKEYDINGIDIHRLIRLINNAISYKVLEHVPLLKFLTGLEKSENIYQFILEKSEKYPELIEGVFTNGTNKEEVYKIRAIVNGDVQENEIVEVENIPVFKGQIHLFYKDSPTSKPSWERFNDKVSKAKYLFDKKGKNAVKEDKYIDFVHSFINSFDNWGQLYGSFFYDNTLINYWHQYLTDYKYLVPISRILLNETGDVKNTFDDNTLPIYNFLSKKDNVIKIIKQIPQGRLSWLAGRIAFYPPNSRDVVNRIVFDWGDFKRNQILNMLLDAQKIKLKMEADKIKIGNVFIGDDITFVFNEKEYVWTWNNSIRTNVEGEDPKWMSADDWIKENQLTTLIL